MTCHPCHETVLTSPGAMVRKSTRTDSICSHRLDACLADTGITATAKSKPAMKHGADQRKFGMWALLRLKRFSKRCLVIRARYRTKIGRASCRTRVCQYV